MNETPRLRYQEVWQRPFVRAHGEWCSAFVLELRLRDVPGPVIGERLAEVEAHCEENGEPPLAAFGDPASYAGRVDAESTPDRVSGVWTVAALGAVQVIAMLVGTAAVRAWAEGGAVTYDAIQLSCLSLVLLVILALPRLVRPLVARPWVVAPLLITLVTLAAVGAATSGRFVSSSVLPVPAAVVAVGLFLVVVGLAWLEHRELTDDDLVTSPLAPAGPGTVTAVRRRSTGVAPAALIPLCYLALGAVSWFVR